MTSENVSVINQVDEKAHAVRPSLDDDICPFLQHRHLQLRHLLLCEDEASTLFAVFGSFKFCLLSYVIGDLPAPLAIDIL